MNIFSFIKDKISVLEIIGQYTTLKKAGTYWKGTCPFHSEKTASFTVSPHKEMFYCFGCHAGGDIVTFMTKIENCSPIEAVQIIADRYALELPESIKSEIKQTTSNKERYSAVCKAVALWCYKLLALNQSAHDYLVKRGVTKKIIDSFTLGFMPSGLKSIKQLIDDMAKESILLQDLLDCGFLIQGKNVTYSPYEDRIIFPIKDYMGRFCGFGGRVYKSEDQRPKYYNSKEHEFFVKGTILFGLHEAKKDIQKSGIAFLVEGYMDCMSMAQYGYHNTVATLGTACTASHLKLLARYAQELYVLYDSDSAGHNAILKLAEMCWQGDLTLKIVQLPQGQDPDSFLGAGNNLQSFISGAQDIFLFFIDSMAKDFAQKTVHEKVALSKQLLTIIKAIEDPLTRDLLLQQASKALDVPFDSLRHELKRTPRNAITHEEGPSTEVLSEKTRDPLVTLGSLEKKIFCAILQDTTLVQEMHHTMLMCHMPEPYRALLELRINLYKEHGLIDFSQFFAKLEPCDQQMVSRMMLQEQKIDVSEFDQLVIYLHKRQWKIVVREITQQLNQAKSMGDNFLVQKILQDFLALKEKIVSTVTQGGDRDSHD